MVERERGVGIWCGEESSLCGKGRCWEKGDTSGGGGWWEGEISW